MSCRHRPVTYPAIALPEKRRIGLVLAPEDEDCVEVGRANGAIVCVLRLREFMAGRLGGGRRLIFGLALAGAGVTVCFSAPHAEPAPDGAIAAQDMVVAVATPEAEATAAVEPRDKKAEATAWVQRCFAKLGYYKGPIDGKANEATWTAHWYFKNDHGLKAYGDFLAEPVQKKLKALCKNIPCLLYTSPSPRD